MPDRSSLHITVAAVVVFADRFLCVEEIDKNSGTIVLNQPAGHVEPGEDLVASMQRELYEETGLQLEPTSWLGISQLSTPQGHCYYRVNFVFEPKQLPAHYQPKDADILALHWLTAEQLLHGDYPLRSALVRQAVQQFQQGHRLPLTHIAAMVSL